MKKSHCFDLAFLAFLAAFPASRPVKAQSIPANIGSVPSTGFGEAPLAGSFNYALTASELISNGFFNNGGASYSTNLSGDAVYQSGNPSHPFSLVYTGGVLLQNAGQPTTTYQELSLSQSLKTKNWNFNIQDAVTYLPESPVSGLSGIPGVGDLGIVPVPVGPESGIGVLTTYGPRVSNTLTGSASRILTARVSAQVSAYEDQQEFIGDNSIQGLNNSGEGATVGLSYRFDSRDSLSANYNYSRFSFGSTYGSFTTQGATVNYSRQWSRRLQTNVYAGPQAVSSSNGLYASTVEIAAGAAASYQSRNATYTLTFARGTNNGSCVIPGSFSDSLNLAAARTFARVWNASANLGYSRITTLPGFQSFSYASQGVTAGVQVARAISRRVYGFGSYTIEHQTLGQNSAVISNAFNGNYQIFAVGVTYSPRKFLFGK